MASSHRRAATRAVLAALALTAGVLRAPPAAADATASDRETARSLMQQGRDLRDKGDLKGALKSFQGADAIMHVPTTALEVARAQIAVGQLVEARDTLAAIRIMPAKPGEPAPFRDARAKAEDLDASLNGRVPAITITLRNAHDGDGTTVTVDGVALSPSAVGLPRAVDAGHHVVVAKNAGGEAKQEVDVREGQTKAVDLTAPNAPPPTPAAAPPIAPAEPTNEAAQATDSQSATSHAPTLLTWIGAGVGGVGLITGVVTGSMTISKRATLQSECPGNSCPPGTASSDLDTANTFATVSTIAFVAAGVGAAVAVVSLVLGHTETDAPTSTPTARRDPTPEWHPWLGLGAAGVRGSF